jgi:hypothetical protein
MKLTGGCYCGAVRYEAEGEPIARSQCHCRECQYITGGAENLVLIMPAAGFRYTKGEAKGFSRPDLETPVTREFCPTCGTHLLTRSPVRASAVILKVGTLDDPKVYEGPQVVIWTSEAQPFHIIPEGVMSFPGFPPSRPVAPPA